jgi:glycine reductase
VKLDLNIIPIRGIKFAPETAIQDGVLSVNGEELRRELLEDKRLSGVGIELAIPDEKCRIGRVVDVVEPRARAGGHDFPGVLGGHVSAGTGTTFVLRGSAVIVTEHWGDEKQGAESPGDFIDMWGPGAGAGPYGKTWNLVITPLPSRDSSLPDYRVALKMAGLRAACYLARRGLGSVPEEVESYDLSSVPKMPALPRVAYIFQVLTNQFTPLSGDPVLYGDNIDRIVPTILHPNEIFDGALVAPYDSRFMETYAVQNHALVKELYRNHGTSLTFAGVIITNAPNNVAEYERAATIAANLSKWTLGADGVVLTKIGGGAPEITMARMAQKCEALGVKTALAFLHMGIDTTDTSLRATTIFNAPEIDAMVSMGAPVGNIVLPAPERVIGIPGGPAATGGAPRGLRQIKGVFSQIGGSRLTAARY